MAKKKKNNAENNKEHQNEGNNKKKGEEKEEKTTPPTTVVLKVDMHCDGCASKIVRFLRGFKGVETVKVEDETGKLTITGIVDPVNLRDKLSKKMKKQVDLISPLPKKENKPQNNNNNNKPEDKKPKEPLVTTAVLKVELHCQGCIERIRKTVLKTKGVHNVAIDREKDTVTVKGTMDVKALTGKLTERLKRKVEVVPPKKEKEKEIEKEGGGGGGGGGDGKKQKGEGGGESKDGGEGKGKMDQSKMEVSGGYGYGYGYDGFGYGYGPAYIHAPQIFSDENPNACSVM